MENVMERLEAKRTYEVELIGDPPYHDEHGNVRPDIKWLPLVKSAAKGIEGTAAEIAAYILERRLDAETCAYDPYFEVLELSESDEARVRGALYEIEVGYSHNGSGVRAPSAIPRREPKSVWIHFTRAGGYEVADKVEALLPSLKYSGSGGGGSDVDFIVRDHDIDMDELIRSVYKICCDEGHPATVVEWYEPSADLDPDAPADTGAVVEAGRTLYRAALGWPEEPAFRRTV
jgi:hypothetical protein